MPGATRCYAPTRHSCRCGVSGLPEPLRRIADLSDRGLFGSCGKLLLYRCSDDREAQKYCGYCQKKSACRKIEKPVIYRLEIPGGRTLRCACGHIDGCTLHMCEGK